MKRVRVAVVGAGVIGSSTAVCIAEALPMCSVTLVADKFSPDTTSDVAAGIFFPTEFPDVPLERQRRWVMDSFDHLSAIAQSEHAADAGVMLLSGWQIFKEVPANKKPFWSNHVMSFRFMTEAELKRFQGYKFGQAVTTLLCECSSYLPWMEDRFRKAGGVVESKKISSLEELNYDIIVNCVGLGSKTLVGDDEVYPIRGQILKVEAPWLKHFIRCGDGLTYIFPGARSITVGGTRQQNDWRLEFDEDDAKSILKRCSKLAPSLKRAKVLSQLVGLRPSRRNPRVEREVVQIRGRRVPVIHNYGHGGWGVTLAWGTSVDVLGLVRQCVNEMQPQAKL
ncbi:D-aspartate oxidase [Brachionichthys hirsutus]|uniref:D-aspartate oxidase n=1 Tax=Brachionichthys hirsutus TaxID=412623 RepID=UPI003604445B